MFNYQMCLYSPRGFTDEVFIVVQVLRLLCPPTAAVLSLLFIKFLLWFKSHQTFTLHPFCKTGQQYRKKTFTTAQNNSQRERPMHNTDSDETKSKHKPHTVCCQIKETPHSRNLNHSLGFKCLYHPDLIYESTCRHLSLSFSACGFALVWVTVLQYKSVLISVNCTLMIYLISAAHW